MMNPHPPFFPRSPPPNRATARLWPLALFERFNAASLQLGDQAGAFRTGSARFTLDVRAVCLCPMPQFRLRDAAVVGVANGEKGGRGMGGGGFRGEQGCGGWRQRDVGKGAGRTGSDVTERVAEGKCVLYPI